MHHYQCPDCGFRVLSDRDDEVVAFARLHHEKRHDAKVSREMVREDLEQVQVSDAGDADYDDLGPVRSDKKASEW